MDLLFLQNDRSAELARRHGVQAAAARPRPFWQSLSEEGVGQIVASAAPAAKSTPPEPTEPTKPTEPADDEKPADDGLVTLDAATYKHLKTRAERPDPPAPVPDGEPTITAAVKAGKFSAERAEHYRQRWQRDPKGTAKLIDRLAAGAVVPEGAAAVATSNAYDPNWIPEVGQRQQQNTASRPRSRVTMED
jgi:hypothetical protein